MGKIIITDEPNSLDKDFSKKDSSKKDSANWKIKYYIDLVKALQPK